MDEIEIIWSNADFRTAILWMRNKLMEVAGV